MILFDNNHLLFIEPTSGPSESPVYDELTFQVAHLLDQAAVQESYFGHHTCSCGACSDGNDWQIPSGQVTNSLAAHYLAYHRQEIPKDEIAKVRRHVGKTALSRTQTARSVKWITPPVSNNALGIENIPLNEIIRHPYIQPIANACMTAFMFYATGRSDNGEQARKALAEIQTMLQEKTL
jgi:hypothetical protein